MTFLHLQIVCFSYAGVMTQILKIFKQVELKALKSRGYKNKRLVFELV